MATLFALCAVCTHWIITGYSLACKQATDLQLALESRNPCSGDSATANSNPTDSAKSK